ncbi:MAG: DUF4430 domain-containing protein [Eubacteriales bacterium]
MKKLFPAIILGLLLCVALVSCSAGAAGGSAEPSESILTTQPFIETSEAQLIDEPDALTEVSETETRDTTADKSEATVHYATVAETTQAAVQPTKPAAAVKPAQTKTPDTTEKATQKPTDKPVIKPAETKPPVEKPTQAPTKATQAPTQAPTEKPTLVPEGNYILISISGYEKKEILKPTVMEFSEGDSVFDLIKKITRDNKIQMEFKGSGLTAYVQGIDNVYEFDHGSQSGWMYKVNGVYPEVSTGRYKVKAGDIVEFVYSTDMGKDRREG